MVFGPVFATPSKERFGAPLGLDVLADVIRSVSIPVFAIGGITPDRVRDCVKRGAHGVAVIRAAMNAPDTGKAVAKFKSALGSL